MYYFILKFMFYYKMSLRSAAYLCLMYGSLYLITSYKNSIASSPTSSKRNVTIPIFVLFCKMINRGKRNWENVAKIRKRKNRKTKRKAQRSLLYLFEELKTPIDWNKSRLKEIQIQRTKLDSTKQKEKCMKLDSAARVLNPFKFESTMIPLHNHNHSNKSKK